MDKKERKLLINRMKEKFLYSYNAAMYIYLHKFLNIHYDTFNN